MHPFGGVHYCPRCAKPVYAAEQIMGPGRKLYHKPCLACTICNKRLDSLSLLEHEQKPYCKTCHIKNFGIRDLRQANLPVVPLREPTPPASSSPRSFSPARVSPPISESRPEAGAVESESQHPKKTALSISTTRSDSFSGGELRSKANGAAQEDETGEERDAFASAPLASPTLPLRLSASYSGTPTNTGRPGHGGIPRTIPLSPTHSMSLGIKKGSLYTQSQSDIVGENRQTMDKPFMQPTTTGTKYSTALGNSLGIQTTGSPRRWGGETPKCPRCGTNVYFAEQVKAVGKTYHKACLRCSECNSLLDSSRLRDHDDKPFCVRCYGKLHGPQGSGYALLGKAGG